MTSEVSTDLKHHGDVDALPRLIDLAVNVRANMPPPWLRDRIGAVDLAKYPDPSAATAAVAERHQRQPDEVLLTAGAAEAFVLLARALRPRLAAVVHPQFTEPEAALRAAGHPVKQVILDEPFELDAGLIPDDADLVIIGNPTNPTSVVHSPRLIASLVRPGRLVVIDEAFADCVPEESASFASRLDLSGLLIVRSLTKTWGLAGLRVGYVLAAPDMIGELKATQPLWAVSSPALEAVIACSSADARSQAQTWARELVSQRVILTHLLGALPGVRVIEPAAASFVLVKTPRADVRTALHQYGFAVRRGETFPGLDEYWIRVAIRDEQTSIGFASALQEVLA